MHEVLHLLTWQSCKVRVCSVSGHGPGMQEPCTVCVPSDSMDCNAALL